MTISLKHTTQAAGTDAGNGEIRKAQWNEEHALTMATARLLGRTTAGAGAVEEISVGAGLSLSGGSLDALSGIDTETADFTFALADAGKTIIADSASAIVGTIPTNAAIPYAIGTKLRVFRAGTGTVKVSPDSGVTLRLPVGVKPKRFMGVACVHAGSTGQNISSDTALPFASSDEFDTDGFHDPSSNNTRITIPADLGIKKVTFSGTVATTNDTADRWGVIYFREDGTTLFGITNAEHGATALELNSSYVGRQVTSGQYYELIVRTESDALSDVSATTTTFRMTVEEIDAQGWIAYQYGAIEIQKIGTNEWIVSDQSALG